MAVYVISDIHGRLDEFKDLIKKSNMKFDGSDELYILGDLVDWGPQSIATVIFVMQMMRKYKFVHCLMGNHDAMMYDTFKDMLSGEEHPLISNIWGINRGGKTYRQFKSLSDRDKFMILNWMGRLPTEFRNVETNGRKFHLTHSYPDIESKMGNIVFNPDRLAYWNRTEIYEYVVGKESEEHILVFGHTITSNYLRDLQIKKNKNIVIYEPRTLKLAIDCGAKCIDTEYGYRLALVNLTNMSVLYSDTKNFQKVLSVPELIHKEKV